MQNHAPRKSPCLGSGLLPRQFPHKVDIRTESSIIEPVKSQSSFTQSEVSDITKHESADSLFCHNIPNFSEILAQIQRPTLKFIPRGARETASRSFSKILDGLCSDKDNLELWLKFFCFSFYNFPSKKPTTYPAPSLTASIKSNIIVQSN
jgi:hypothetical protein